jgi:hypothetical protein
LAIRFAMPPCVSKHMEGIHVSKIKHKYYIVAKIHKDLGKNG